MLVGPSKQLKQIIQIEHNIVKNPNWPEANQLAIYKRGRGFELGATEKQIQVVARAGLEPGTARLRARHSDHSTKLLPFCVFVYGKMCSRKKENRQLHQDAFKTICATDDAEMASANVYKLQTLATMIQLTIGKTGNQNIYFGFIVTSKFPLKIYIFP